MGSEMCIRDRDIVPQDGGGFHMLYDDKAYHAHFIASDFDQKRYTVQVNGQTFQIRISDELDALIGKMGFTHADSKLVSTVTAPMPGLILDTMASVGDEVAVEQPLLILEAMKMENVITSPRAGIIKTIAVHKGDTVEKNAALVEFE